jgi:hypothetical protein
MERHTMTFFYCPRQQILLELELELELVLVLVLVLDFSTTSLNSAANIARSTIPSASCVLVEYEYRFTEYDCEYEVRLGWTIAADNRLRTSSFGAMLCSSACFCSSP